MKVHFRVNGKDRQVETLDSATLLSVLRDDLGLPGTKEGCGEGECGACTVLVNGRAVVSCLMLACQAEGAEILTIEGLEKDGLHPIQQAFIDEGAVQCGFCTPGFIMTTKALLKENPSPTESEIREYLKGNYCRCTGYINIINAVQSAAKKLQS